MTHILSELAVSNLSDHRDLTYQSCAEQGVRYAMAILRNQNDAEEAVQEAFCRLHVSGKPENESAFKGRFFLTLRNHCIDLIRRRTVRSEVELNAVIEDSATTRNQAELDELMRAVELSMSRLPENWKQALQLRVHGELSYDEIAQITGSTLGQVRTWIYRGRRQLENELSGIGILNKQEQLNNDDQRTN